MKAGTPLLLILILVFSGCSTPTSSEVRFDLVKDYIDSHLSRTIVSVKELQGKIGTEKSISAFEKAREEYKKVEAFLDYFLPKKTHGVNGPPLPVYLEDSDRVLHPIGFQALGEQLYTDEPLDSALYYYRLKILVGYLETIQSQIEPIEINPRRFFIPMHQKFMNVFALGLISFDTPTSLRGIEESVINLNSVKEIYSLSISDTLKILNEELHHEFIENLNGAINYLKQNSNFETFNRYEFTRKYLNKLTRNWRDIRREMNLFGATKSIAINMDAPTFFEKNSFNIGYFTGFKTTPSKGQVLLGKKLFFDKRLSVSGALSCGSCHKPDNAYQDGLVLGLDKDSNPLQRNTPTILNSVFQRKLFWDGRADNLTQQINLVFDNDMEFGRGAAHDLSLVEISNQEYDSLFAKVFPDSKKVSKRSVIRSLAAYVSTLNDFDSRFDKNMRGELDDFTEQEVLGMNLYMGKALCATCHFLPLTNGTVPPGFRETEKEVIGVPETADNLKLDDDNGFYWVFQTDIHKGMFKTPTIRNIELTAPYMHNGVYETLEQVVDFYNKGGGGGMGFDLSHQTLPFDSLNLSIEEQAALVAFMKTFTDAKVEEIY